MRSLMVRGILTGLLGVMLWGAAPAGAEAGFVLRDVRAREVLDPIGLYEAELALFGLPGTFVQGARNPADRDYITIFDIPDIAGVVFNPPGWLGSTDRILLPDEIPDGFGPFDPLAEDKITFSYIDGAPLQLGNQGELFVGAFSWQTFDVPKPIFPPSIRYIWQTSRLVNGVVIKEVGFGIANVFVIPEPASLCLTAGGLCVAAAFVRSRRRRSRRPPQAG